MFFKTILTIGNEICLEEVSEVACMHVCSDVGVVLLPTKVIVKHAETGTLGRTPKEGPLYHYHIKFEDDRGEFKWVLRNGVRESVEKFFHRIEK